jgi:hypothetical protein
LALLGSDPLDANGCGPSSLTYSFTPANGTVVVDMAAGTATYCPAPNFCGIDSISYTVSDGECTVSGLVVVTVVPVNDCPVANAQSASTCEDTPVPITLTGSDVDAVNGCGAATLTFAIVQPPAHGTLSGAPPNLIYTPSQDYNGPDSFTFSVSDGECAATATVSVLVKPVVDPPVCKIVVGPLLKVTPTVTVNEVLACSGGKGQVVLDASLSTGEISGYLWLVDGVPVGAGVVITNEMPLGTHDITLVVSYDDTGTDPTCQGPGAGTVSCAEQVSVIDGCEAVEEVVTLLESMNLPRRDKRPYISRLKNACGYFDKGRCTRGLDELQAFQNKVHWGISLLYPAEAQQLIQAAQVVIDAYRACGCK